MWCKRVSLILFLIGLSLCLNIPIKGLWSVLIRSNAIKTYEQQAIDYQQTPELVKSIEQQLDQGNVYSIEDPFDNVNMLPSSQEATFPKGAVGFLKIPKINEKIPLYMGASDNNLANGCAHIAGTDLPLSGKETHTVIAGHRGYYGSTYFLYIDYLVAGDLIYVSYFGKEAVYAVTGNELIDPTEGAKLREYVANEERLTLLTCHPFPTALQRLLVHSRRLTDEELEKNQAAGLVIENINNSEQVVSSDNRAKNIEPNVHTQEVRPKGIQKKIGEIGQQSMWLYICLIFVGGNVLIFVFWHLIRTWL